MSLQERADKIINSGINDNSITELQRIKREMSKLYDEAIVSAGMAEQNYNFIRSEAYIKIKKQYKGIEKKLTESEAEKFAKNEAEKERGQWRLMKSKAMGIKAKMNAIDGLCLDFYSKRKNETIASNVLSSN